MYTHCHHAGSSPLFARKSTRHFSTVCGERFTYLATIFEAAVTNVQLKVLGQNVEQEQAKTVQIIPWKKLNQISCKLPQQGLRVSSGSKSVSEDSLWLFLLEEGTGLVE